MKKAKEKKMKTKDLARNGSMGDTPIYVNDHLAPERKKTLVAIKSRKTELNIKYIWTSNGTIFARKADGSPAVKIQQPADIEKVK